MVIWPLLVIFAVVAIKSPYFTSLLLTLQTEQLHQNALKPPLLLPAGDKTNARIFLNAPNRHLENHAPIEFIQNGDLAPLELFVDAMNVRQPA
jgi:hypothetical protein